MKDLTLAQKALILAMSDAMFNTAKDTFKITPAQSGVFSSSKETITADTQKFKEFLNASILWALELWEAKAVMDRVDAGLVDKILTKAGQAIDKQTQRTDVNELIKKFLDGTITPKDSKPSTALKDMPVVEKPPEVKVAETLGVKDTDWKVLAIAFAQKLKALAGSLNVSEDKILEITGVSKEDFTLYLKGDKALSEDLVEGVATRLKQYKAKLESGLEKLDV